MEMALTLKDLGMIALFIAIIVLIIYLIIVMKNLISVLKKADSVLEDVNEISEIASNRTAQIDGALDTALAKVASAICTIANYIKKEKLSKNESQEGEE